MNTPQQSVLLPHLPVIHYPKLVEPARCNLPSVQVNHLSEAGVTDNGQDQAEVTLEQTLPQTLAGNVHSSERKAYGLPPTSTTLKETRT